MEPMVIEHLILKVFTPWDFLFKTIFPVGEGDCPCLQLLFQVVANKNRRRLYNFAAPSIGNGKNLMLKNHVFKIAWPGIVIFTMTRCIFCHWISYFEVIYRTGRKIQGGVLGLDLRRPFIFLFRVLLSLIVPEWIYLIPIIVITGVILPREKWWTLKNVKSKIENKS